MNQPRALETTCPYCQGAMRLSRASCDACQIAVEGTFPASRLASLPIEHQRFIEMFVLASGSLKEIARHTHVSYPTLRSRLDKVIESLRDEIAQTRDVDGTVLDGTSEGQATPEDAARLIKAI